MEKKWRDARELARFDAGSDGHRRQPATTDAATAPGHHPDDRAFSLAVGAAVAACCLAGGTSSCAKTSPPRCWARLEGGQLDFALIALPFETGNLCVEKLFDDELWIVGRQGDPELTAHLIEPSPALTDRLLLLEGHCLRDHALYACGDVTAVRKPRAVEATSLLTLVQMVESGLGIGLVPAMAVRCTASPTARP